MGHGATQVGFRYEVLTQLVDVDDGLSPSGDDAGGSGGVDVLFGGEAHGHHVVVEQDAVIADRSKLQQADVIEESVCGMIRACV